MTLYYEAASSGPDFFYQGIFEILEEILQSSRKSQDLCKVAAGRMRTLVGADQVLIVYGLGGSDTNGDCVVGSQSSGSARLADYPALRKHLADILEFENISLKRFLLEGEEAKSACGLPLINAEGDILGAVFLLGLPGTMEIEGLLECRLIFLVRYFSEVFYNALNRELQEDLIAQRTDALRQEIEERKSVERVLRKSRDEWEETFNALPDLVTLLDPQMTIVKANRMACELLEYEQSDIVGKKCHEVFGDHREPCPDCPFWETTIDNLSHSNVICHW